MPPPPFVLDRTISTEAPRIAFRRQGVIEAALASNVLGFALTIAGYALGEPLWALMGYSLIGLSFGIMALRFGRARPGRIEVHAQTARFGDRTVSLARLREAYVQPRFDKTPEVVLRGRSSELARVEVTDDATARALIEALGLSPSRAAATFASGTRWWVQAIWIVLLAQLVLATMVALWQAGLSVWLAGPPIGLLALIGLVRRFRSRVTVGADGILVSRFARKFYPWSQIRVVQGAFEGVAILLTSGERVIVPTAANNMKHDLLAAAIIERATQAQLALQADDVGASRLPTFPGLTARERLRALRGLVQRGGDGYRAQTLSPERLVDVAANASLAPHQRANAAVAASASMSPDAKKRIRIAADACAEPRVRAVLDAIAAEAEEEAIAEALAACDEPKTPNEPAQGSR